MNPLDLELYRPNVGIVVFDRTGRVFIGRRRRTPGPLNWQFPQGGVDAGEEWEAAARRELREETGITSVTLLASTSDWITYDFPPEAMRAKAWRGYKGQKQRWYAFRFEGDDSEIDLRAHPPVEFDAWKWVGLDETMDYVVPFKREAYRTVIEAFRPFAD